MPPSILSKILNELINSLQNGNVLIFGLIAVFAFIFNFKKIIEFIDERKKNRLVTLDNALKCEFIQGLSKSHIEEELATEQFNLSTGIKLEKESREAIIRTHKNTNGELSFTHFKRSIPHLIYKESKIQVKISFIEHGIFLFNCFCGVIMALAGITFMLTPSQIDNLSLPQGLMMFGLSIFFSSVAFFMLYQTFPVLSAKLVSKELKKNEQL